MKSLILLSILVVGLAGSEKLESCYDDVQSYCSKLPSSVVNCNSKFSSVHTVMSDLRNYVHQHIIYSYKYLLMATNFGNYLKNREGFVKLFRKMSDSTWEDAIHLIKYISKRGGSVKFDELVHSGLNLTEQYDMHELESLSLALDMTKSLATTAHHIHGEVTKGSDKRHDADTINFLEDKFVEKHTSLVRDLAGHTNDLKNLAQGKDVSLSFFLFDEYLKSIY